MAGRRRRLRSRPRKTPSPRRRNLPMNKQPDSGNLIIEMLLSVVVYMAWIYFYEGPRMERERLAHQAAQSEQQKTAAPAGAVVPGTATAPGTAPGAAVPRETILGNGASRLHFENDKVDGSINLIGARID